MAAVYKDSLGAVVLRLVIFWWLVFTLIAFGEDIQYLLELTHFGQIVYARLWYIIAACVVAVAFVGLYVFLFKEKVKVDLTGRSEMGLKTTMGRLPMPVDPLPRATPSKRLALCDETVAVWLLSQNVPVDSIIPTWTVERSRQYSEQQAQENRQFRDRVDEIAASQAKTCLLVSEHYRRANSFSCTLSDREPITTHGALFLAVWDTYCAHSHFPASHRVGGHGNVKLHVHCLSVAAQCLREIDPADGAWKFDGIYVKRRGRNPIKFLENSNGYQLSPVDPIIPIAGLAHDLGKLLAYEVDEAGLIKKNREPRGNTLADDDAGVIHDTMGPRVLTRLPEFWKIPQLDRPALTTALAHYHHPSKFPVTNVGIISNFRAGALMMLLIKADRAVSAAESGIDPTVKSTSDLGEEELEALYETFVQIITTPGRINGLGDQAIDAKLRIGQKHEDFIVVKLSALLALMRQELNISLDSGEKKHELTNHLLAILKEKGLLYTEHNGADFSLYNPLYRVSFYNSQSSKHFGDVAPALLLNQPTSEMKEFYALTHLALNPANVVVKNLILSHIPKNKIKDKDHLDELRKKAFEPSAAGVDVHDDVTDNPEGLFITDASELAKNLSKEAGDQAANENTAQAKAGQSDESTQNDSGQNKSAENPKIKASLDKASKLLKTISPEVMAKVQEEVKDRGIGIADGGEQEVDQAEKPQSLAPKNRQQTEEGVSNAIPEYDFEAAENLAYSAGSMGKEASKKPRKRKPKPSASIQTASTDEQVTQQTQELAHEPTKVPPPDRADAQMFEENEGAQDEVTINPDPVSAELQDVASEHALQMSEVKAQPEVEVELRDEVDEAYPAEFDDDSASEPIGGLGLPEGDAPLDDDDVDVDQINSDVDVEFFAGADLGDEIAHSIHRGGKVYRAKKGEHAPPVDPSPRPAPALPGKQINRTKASGASTKRASNQSRTVIRGAGERL